MSTFIYGVFQTTQDFSKALSDLKAIGLTDVVIVKNTGEGYSSATLNPSRKTPFIIGGAIGAIIGGFAGAMAAPSLDVGGFQLVTIMAMVSSSVICSYFGLWLAGFLYFIDRPVLEHEVFEGTVTNGAMVLGVTVDSSEEKLKAIECMDANRAVEVVARATSTGIIEQLPESSENVQPIAQLVA